MWQIQGNNELGSPHRTGPRYLRRPRGPYLPEQLSENSFLHRPGDRQDPELQRPRQILSAPQDGHGSLHSACAFRAITTTDRQEEVKWLNVFQEASFSLDRSTGRCVGTVTWTDKLIRSMDSGFFRLLDASRYMELDGITAKHMYRFLAVAFEKTDLLVMDARTLAMQNLGILNLPKYFSRLLQTLEPAFDQLIRLQILASYHVVSGEEWKIALHRHASYVPATQTLMLEAAADPELQRAQLLKLLERSGFTGKHMTAILPDMPTRQDCYAVQRALRLFETMKEHEVLPHVAMSLIRRGLETGSEGEGRDLLDTIEMAIDVCRQKREAGQKLRNSGGFLVSFIKDEAIRRRLFSLEHEKQTKQVFRQREMSLLRQEQQAEERVLILQYEAFRAGTRSPGVEGLERRQTPQPRQTKARPAARPGSLQAPSRRGSATGSRRTDSSGPRPHRSAAV